MNKEAIERTKARCIISLTKKDGLRFWVRPKPILIKEALAENQQLFNQFRNPKHMPLIVLVSYGDPLLNLWDPLTPKQYVFVALASVSIVAFVVWWAQNAV